MPFFIAYRGVSPQKRYHKRQEILHKMFDRKEISHQVLKSSSILSREYSNIRVVIAIVCVVGFVYQVWDLTEQYLGFPTKLVREISYHTEKYIQSPALTICVDKVFDYDKLNEQFPHFAEQISVLRSKETQFFSSSQRHILVCECLPVSG